MQPFEIVLVAFGALTAIAVVAFHVRERKYRIGVGAVLIAVLGLQVYLEGYRWHMAGTYLSVFLLLAVLLNRFRMSTLLISSLVGFSLVGVAASVAAATLFPVFKFPALSGPYGVGTTVMEFPGGPSKAGGSLGNEGERIVVVQLFYPAEPSANTGSMYTLAGLATRFKPQLRKVQTQAMVNAIVASSGQPFPIILYSHSWNGSRLENVALVQQLASHGYVVACVDDTKYTPITVFADGRARRHAGEHWLDFSSQSSLESSMRRARAQLDGRVADVSFVLDQLIWMNKGEAASQFFRRLNTDQVGVLGFSFGGTTAAQACRIDHRLKAGVNLDGFAFTLSDATPISQPFLNMTESVPADQDAVDDDPVKHAEWIADKIEFQRAASAIQAEGGYYLTVEGTDHVNFSDFPLYSRLRFYTGAGPISPLRAMYIVSSYTVSFFDQYLRNEPSSLLSGPSPAFPEVAFVLRRVAETAVIH